MTSNRKSFVVVAVTPLEGHRLQLAYADGVQCVADLGDWIKATKALRPLRDPALFATARPGSFGRTVEFGDGSIDLGGDNLRNLAVEQAGGIGHERIWNWMHNNDLTIDQAANALGLSRRMLIYYRNGEKPVPRHVWLACLGWETLYGHKEAA